MLSHEEQRRLDDIADHLRRHDPDLARRLDPICAQQHLTHRSDMRILAMVLLGAVVLSIGVATMPSSVVVGSLITGLGCALLISTVRTARTTTVAPGSPGQQPGRPPEDAS